MALYSTSLILAKEEQEMKQNQKLNLAVRRVRQLVEAVVHQEVTDAEWEW